MTTAERKQSANDRSRMKIQPKKESHQQGAEMSRYSRKKKMTYNNKKYNERVIKHYKKKWDGDFKAYQLNKGPMSSFDSDFRVLEFKPNTHREMWTYATCGMSYYGSNNPIELHLFSSIQDETIIELLTAISYFSKTDGQLGLNHTVNFGRPWQSNSKCSYGLISLPYLDGPNLEILNIDRLLTCFYWLIPITENELEYKKQYGVELLEQKFDQQHFNYLDPDRKSVV